MGNALFTFLTSLAVGAALFILSNQYVRANSLQAAEFNLRLVATSIETSLESADALLNWASIDSTVRRYISQENINGTQTIAAYEAMQEKYYSSTLYSHILRFFVTNENDRHLQFGPLNSSAALNRTSVKQFLTKGYGMQFTTDPLLPGSPSCIAISQPVRCGKGTLHRGSTYLALDTAIITDPAAGYSLTDGSALYWEMGSRLWQIENGSLTEIENPLREVDYTLRTGSNNGVTEQTAWQGKVQLDGQKYYVVKVTLNGRSAALVQLLPANTFFAALRRVPVAGRPWHCHHLGTELFDAALAGAGHHPPGGGAAKAHRNRGQRQLCPPTARWSGTTSWATSAGASTSWLKTWTA